MCQTFGRSVSAVRRREGVVDIDVAIGCECCDKLRLVLFLALVEAGVFEKQNITVFQRIDCGLCLVANAVFCKVNTMTEHFRQRFDDMLQRVFIGSNAFWTTEMGEQNNLGALLRQFRNSWNDAFDTGEVGYLAASHRHVEVNTNQNAL
ncbi:hypothetical protein D9M69_586450 [compost metagenome]